MRACEPAKPTYGIAARLILRSRLELFIAARRWNRGKDISGRFACGICRGKSRNRRKHHGGRWGFSHHDASADSRSEEHTAELPSLAYLVSRLLPEKKKKMSH